MGVLGGGFLGGGFVNGGSGGGGGGGVMSVFGRMGPAISAAAGDYTAAQVSSSVVGLAGTDVEAKLVDAKAQIDAAAGAASAAQGDATAALAAAGAAQATANTAQGDATAALAAAGAAQATANAKLASFNGRTAPAVVPTAGDYSAALVSASTTGLAGATVQANLDDAASRLYTRVVNNTPTALGSAPTYLPLLTIPIAAGTRILLDGYILLSGGTQSAPTSGVISFGGVSNITARRPTVGAPTVSGTPAVVGGTIPALAAQAVISGNDLVIQARATGGPSVTSIFYYRVEVLSTPP